MLNVDHMDPCKCKKSNSTIEYTGKCLIYCNTVELIVDYLQSPQNMLAAKVVNCNRKNTRNYFT
jgi:hypothetical protein